VASPSTFDKKLALFLRKKRGEMPYRDFARKLGIHRSTLHRLEHSEQSITLAKLELIMRRLKCNFSDIFGTQGTSGLE
jgi:transcriptional regulator with XRE-family HTH domain